MIRLKASDGEVAIYYHPLNGWVFSRVDDEVDWGGEHLGEEGLAKIRASDLMRLAQ